MAHIPYYKLDTINHNNWYTICKYIFMAPIALLRFIGLIAAFMNMIFVYTYFPKTYDIFCYSYAIIVTSLLGFYSIKIKNKHLLQNAVDNNATFIYNHISIADGFILSALYPFAIIINASHGVYIKNVITSNNGILIEKKPNQTQKILDHVNSKKRNLIIAPEGMVTNGKYLAPFKLGAFLSLNPIQPVLMRYNYKYYNPFFSEDHPCIVLYRMLTQIVNYVTIELLPLEYPLLNETPAEFAERVRTIMAEALHVQKV